AGVADGLLGGDDGVLRVAVEPARLLPVDVGLGVEPLQLAGEPRREVARVEVRDGAGPALPPHHALPGGGDGEADGRDGAEAGDDDAGAGDGHGGRAGAGEGKSRGPEGKGERKSGREEAVPPFTRSPSPPVRRGVREGSGAPLRLDVVDG